ncbi:MAG: ubiquinol-cytochrome c reductase iron-sulfur subunit [Comamonadaceae bacterium]|nr:ubiquinol-cytochrome c reductase iron-sulfur subunit [Comamonadaceae bacterium]
MRIPRGHLHAVRRHDAVDQRPTHLDRHHLRAPAPWRGVAVAVPFVSAFAPSERAKCRRALRSRWTSASIAPGEMMTVEWRGKPVWILRRTPEHARGAEEDRRPAGRPAVRAHGRTRRRPTRRTSTRSIKPEFFVAVGICSHLGCSPAGKFSAGAAAPLLGDWPGGFLCPCHGSTFDLAGRVFKNKPAPDNLEVPPHMYLSDTVLLIGEDKKA